MKTFFFKGCLTLIIIVVGSMVITLIAMAFGNNVSTRGIGPFIIIPAIIAAIWAIWKHKANSK